MRLLQEVVRSKRDGHSLSGDDLKALVRGLTTGTYSDAQVGAMAMAIYLQGMSVSEVSELTLAIANSGSKSNDVALIGHPFRSSSRRSTKSGH